MTAQQPLTYDAFVEHATADPAVILLRTRVLTQP